MLSTQAPAVAAADEEGAAGGAGGAEAAANQHAAPMGEAMWQVRCCRCVLGCEPDLLRSWYAVCPLNRNTAWHTEAPAMGAAGEAGGAGGAPPRRRRQCGVVFACNKLTHD